jgi:hypothetical protein
MRRIAAIVFHRAAIWHARRRMTRLIAVPWRHWQNGHIRRIDQAQKRIDHHRRALTELQRNAGAAS